MFSLGSFAYLDRNVLVCLGSVLLSGPVTVVQALPSLASTDSDPEAHGAVSLRWENDAFAVTDRDYSNGTC